MTDLNRLNTMLEFEEGCKQNLYLCTSKKLTVGVGHNMEDKPLTGKQWRALYDAGEVHVVLGTNGQRRILAWDVEEAERQCKARMDFWPRLNDARQNVLISMVFQMGIDGVMQFKNMIAAIRAEDWNAAERHGLDSKWAKTDSPARAKRHMRQLKTGAFQ